jgi:RNA polymerase sigma-70 factor, ECF subfamily
MRCLAQSREQENLPGNDGLVFDKNIYTPSHSLQDSVLISEMTMRMESLATTPTTHLDKQALAGIYEQHSPGIFRYAYRMLGNQDLAEECVAETFSRFLHVVHGGSAPTNVQAYLYRVAHNWITDSYRRQTPTIELDAEMHADPSENPAHSTADELERERVRTALKGLPAEQRLVITLRFLEDRSHEEAAAVLGRSVEATRALQHRALAALRRMLIETEK